MPPRERVHFAGKRSPIGDLFLWTCPPCVHFLTLSHDEQAAAIRRLASLGFGDHAIAQRTGWHVIEVRRALAAHRERIDFRYAR